MSKPKIFVDGQEGTTGLKIHEYLLKRDDLEILFIDPEKRKDREARREIINNSDIVFLCLPDAAAIESVSLIENENTRVIDASTAHRTNEEWAYGLPELSDEHRSAVKTSKRVCVPGCHASGFIALVYPLVRMGILPSDYPVSCTSITGYSGGGKSLINKYESKEPPTFYNSPRHYALKLKHKHLPEMKKVTGLKYAPIFSPVIGNFYNGMVVSVPLMSRLLKGSPSARDIHALLYDYYNSQHFVRVMPFDDDNTIEEGLYINPEKCNGTNSMDLFVFGHEEQIMLFARFDNLGKGASGAAIQNMNIMLGVDETAGLALSSC